MKDRLHKPRTEDTSPKALASELRNLAEKYAEYPNLSTDLRRLLATPPVTAGSSAGEVVGR